MKGKLIIISAPSGAGKTSIVQHLLNSNLNIEFSVSATTRAPRGNEQDGKDYHFYSIEDFKKLIDEDKFAEWEEVYTDHFYGTLKSEIERITGKGKNIIFDVDTKGGINLKKLYGKYALSVFVMPPSVRELEKRLINRGTDKPEKIKMRIKKATLELSEAEQFDHIVINDNLCTACSETYNLVLSFIDGKV